MKEVEAGRAEDAPIELMTPRGRALHDNLQPWLAARPASLVAEPTLVVVPAAPWAPHENDRIAVRQDQPATDLKILAFPENFDCLKPVGA